MSQKSESKTKNMFVRHLWHNPQHFDTSLQLLLPVTIIQQSKVSSFRVLRLCIILRKIQIICGLPLLGCRPRVSGSLRTAEKLVLLGQCPFRGEWGWGGKLLEFMMSTGDEWGEVSNAVFTMRAWLGGSVGLPSPRNDSDRGVSSSTSQIRSSHETKRSNNMHLM